MAEDASNDTSRSATTSDALSAAGKRRIELKQAVGRVEIATARPAADPSWAATLATELGDLVAALEHHVDEVEGPTGLLTELFASSPRLANQIEYVKAEHPTLIARAKGVLNRVRLSDEPESLRDDVLDLLLAIARHRQRGADLVYAAYNIDIGGDG
jgi:hypothetical protein